MPANSSRRDFLLSSASAVGLATAAARSATAAGGSPKLKIGQIGVGHSHAEGKIVALRSSPDWDVVGVVENDPQLRAAAAQRDAYRDLRWMNEEQLLDTPGLQAVAVETSMKKSLDVAETCVAAGLPIHLDKPPGASYVQFKKLLEAADRQQLVVQMGYMYRYNPAVKLLRNLLTKGWLGKVFEVHAVMSKQIGKSKRKRYARFKGGSMFELGCHLIDLLVGILGRPEKVTAFNRHSGDFEDGLLDNMLAVCEYPTATATIKSAVVEVEGGDRRHLVVCGTEGTLHIQPLDRPTARLALAEPRGDYKHGYQTITFGKYERYVDDLADLAAIVRGEKASDFDSAHDLAAQETLLKACEMPLGS